MDSLAGALLMNVGMHELQDELFAQAQSLTEVQKEAIYHHPEKSAEILKLAGLSNQPKYFPYFK
jgi:HD-GYP domain-containing protein (c-di-GMP phosphodiesterase class II)